METNKNISTINLTAREYYNFKLLALKFKVMYTVSWNNNSCDVKCETPFIHAMGYADLAS